MSKGMIFGIIGAVVVGISLICAIFIGCWIFSIYNGEIALRTRFEKQENVVESTMDNMRKTLMNQYSVSKEFAETFIKVSATVASGRSGGSLFKSVTESSGNVNQGFTPELANKMMNSIEGKLAEFKRSMDTEVDIWGEHKVYCSTMPNALFVGNKVFPKPQVISSEVSKAAIKNGILEDIIIKQD